jgi:hypothetical protein
MLSRVIADVIEVADFSGMTAFDALVALRQCAWDYRLYFTVDESRQALLNFTKLTTGSPVALLKPLDLSPIPNLLASPPEVGFMPGWSRRLLPVKNAVDVVPWGPTGSGEFTTGTVQSAGSTWSGKYLVDVSTERPLRVVITCIMGGDVRAPEATAAANRKPILWSWERMADTAHCWLSAACTAATETLRVAGVSIKGGQVYAGDVLIVAGDYLAVSDGDQRIIKSFGVITDGYAEVTLSSVVGVAASQYAEVTIEPHERRTTGISSDGVTTLAAIFTLGTTSMVVADASDIAVGAVVLARDHAWQVTKVVSSTLTVSELYAWAVSPDITLPIGTKLSVCVYTEFLGKHYQVGQTGVLFGVDTDSDDAPSRTVNPGDGVIVTATGTRLAELKCATIREMNSSSIGNESSGYGRCDTSINNRFVDLLRGTRLAAKVLVDAWPRIEVTGLKIPAIWPTLTIGSEVTISDPRIVPTIAGVEQSASFHVTGIRYDLAACTSEITVRSAAASSSGKRSASDPTPGTALPAGRSGEI